MTSRSERLNDIYPIKEFCEVCSAQENTDCEGLEPGYFHVARWDWAHQAREAREEARYDSHGEDDGLDEKGLRQ